MEIERNWLTHGWPEDLEPESVIRMEQGYITTRPTVRIRREVQGEQVRLVLCFKGKAGPDGLAREEIETDVAPELFQRLERFIGRPLIQKEQRRYALAGGLTLVMMVLPTIITNTRESLSSVPQAYREGALALGSGKWHMVRTVVLPNAVDGIVTGCILAVGRIVGESAALLYTAGFGLELVGFVKALHTSSATLTVALYVYATEGGETALAFSIAAILMVLTLLINLSASLVGRKLRKK